MWVLNSLVPSCLSMQPSPQIVSPTFRVWLLLPSSVRLLERSSRHAQLCFRVTLTPPSVY